LASLPERQAKNNNYMKGSRYESISRIRGTTGILERGFLEIL
jgi:hypothetical protein